MSGVMELVSLFPDTLLDDSAGGQAGSRWWVLYTKVNQEKMLARHLFGCRIGFYLPLVAKTCVCRGRLVDAHVPLFTGYVFLFGTEEDRVASLTTNRVSRVLPIHDAAGLVQDLRQLRRLIESDAPLTAERRLAPGGRVRVRHGPLAGIEGTVLQRRGATRLLVAVSFLQQGASVEIDDYMLEPIF